MENVGVYQELERRVAERTAQLETRTAELQARTKELLETNETIRALYEDASDSFEALRTRNQHHVKVLHTLAHEVRTPLAAGKGILQLALRRDASLDDPTRSDLADVEAALGEAIDVVSRQLDAAREEAGTVSVRREPVDLAAELAGLRGMLRALVRSDAVTLVVDEPGERIELCTDRALLGHVLRNLVGNALKFTDAGEVRVTARSSDCGRVELAVSDTGIGIAEEDLERILREWQQVEGAQPERPGGSGLGLPIVLRLIKALGGELRVESERGRGSTFTIELPSGTPDGRN
jgi:signal transduction histidine kinase